MDKVVYFLGAGFSAPLGLPVMSNFLIKSKDMYASDPHRFAHFSGVFEIIKEMSVSKNYFETDLFNIEEILSILEMRQQLQGAGLEQCFVKYLIEVVEYFTPHVRSRPNLPINWHRYVFPSPLEHAYGYFVASLLNLSLGTTGPEVEVTKSASPSASYSIITLNYDCVIENFESFFGRCHGGEAPSCIPMAKLHGSVDSKCIVPPTWNKVLHPESVADWKQAFDLLREANHIRIIGYSLPTADSYVKYLLKSAAMAAPHLKAIDVLCMDPTGAVKARYDEFISFYRYRFTRASVVDYLNGHLESLVKPFDHDFGKPMPCDKLEGFHEGFFSGLGLGRGQTYGDERRGAP